MKIQVRCSRFTSGFEIVLHVYRRWKRDTNWTDWPTYRYVGLNINRSFRIGRFVGWSGRVYWYFGFLTFWQDIQPAKRQIP